MFCKAELRCGDAVPSLWAAGGNSRQQQVATNACLSNFRGLLATASGHMGDELKVVDCSCGVGCRQHCSWKLLG